MLINDSWLTWLKKFANEKIQYRIGTKNIDANPIVIIELARILLFNFLSNKWVREFVATANKIETLIAFKKGLKSSTIKKIITIAIAIKK